MRVQQLMEIKVVGVGNVEYGPVSEWFGCEFVSSFYGAAVAHLEDEFDRPTAEGLARVFLEVYCSGYADGCRVSEGRVLENDGDKDKD